MVQNLKIDIIYYDTPSDFEFEFNLGGCCHSRILNSHTHQPKEMLSGLARAVSRSRIILIIGELHGDCGITDLVSKAVSIPLVGADTSEYIITSPEEPMVLKGSLPLVSKDGTLSGCIIESGPQSIILLPESKALRKEICDNLVFPYITALSRVPETDNVINEDSAKNAEETETVFEDISLDSEENTEDVTEASDNVIEMTEEAIEETAENLNEAEELAKIEEVSAEENEEDQTEEEIVFTKENANTILTEAKSEDEQDSISINDDFIIANMQNATDSEDTADYDEGKAVRKPVSKLTVAILILIGLMLIVAGALLYMLVYYPMASSIPVTEYVKEFFDFL